MKKILMLPDTAYMIRQETIRFSDGCDICEGSGSVWLKGREFICPLCNGSGGRGIYKKRWAVLGPVHFVSATVSIEAETECTYKYMTSALYGNPEWNHTVCRQSELFLTEEEARRAADARNAGEERNLRVAEVI